jgi:hypothetical protein
MPSLSHAEDRDTGCSWCLRQFAYVQVRYSCYDRQVQDPECLHLMPQGQVHGLGNSRTANLERHVAVAHRAMRSSTGLSATIFHGRQVKRESAEMISFTMHIAIL